MTNNPSLTLKFDYIGPVKGSLTLDFRPGLNILTGKNGSGKSNIIDAATVATSGQGKLNAHYTLLPDGTPQVYPALVSEGDKVLAKTSRDRAPLFASSLPSAPM
ncbi:MAG: AAA family ATPase, partial [Thermoleophilia bacterium]